MRRARLAGGVCVACGREPGSVHHVIPRGERGDDVAANFVLLCGSGASGCHGAFHGSAYEARVFVGSGFEGPVYALERRDFAWVAARIGKHLAERRPDTLAYVAGKLGSAGAAGAYLERRYLVVLPDSTLPAAPSA